MKRESKSLQSTIENLPNAPGVYVFRDAKGKPLYVGKAVNLKNRVRSYFHPSLILGAKTQAMVKKIAKIEHIEVESEIEALILEADLIKILKPYYNVQWKDDKAHKYIKISNLKSPAKGEALASSPSRSGRQGRQISKLKEEKISSESFARVKTTRRTDDKNAYYFGPFPEGRTVNKVLSSLRRIFRFADCSKTKFSKYKKLGHGCLYADLGLCPAPCAGLISPKDYQIKIDRITAFLQGKKKKLLRDLERQMKKAAQEKNFEQAAILRDEIKRMKYITQTFRGSSDYLEHPNLLEDKRRDELKVLLKELSGCLPRRRSRLRGQAACPVGEAVFGVKLSADFRIEAYDISNISGKQATGSQIVFIDGEPDKSEYRRYKVTIEGKPDDIAMTREVLCRRLKKLKVKNEKLKVEIPNLILVDGGIGQLNAALGILEKYKLEIPVVALAKRWETLYVPTETGAKAVSLRKDSPTLKLLQRIRDEAHRFAAAYHRKLREKNLFIG